MPQRDAHLSKFNQRQRLTALGWAFVGAILFSNKAILAKLMYREGADALDTITLRMLFAFPLFLALLVWTHFTDHEHAHYRLTRRDYRREHIFILFVIKNKFYEKKISPIILPITILVVI